MARKLDLLDSWRFSTAWAGCALDNAQSLYHESGNFPFHDNPRYNDLGL